MDYINSHTWVMGLAFASVVSITALAALGRVSSMEISGNRLFRIVLRFTARK